MTSSSTSDHQVDLEKAHPSSRHPDHITTDDNACLAFDGEKDCQGWAAGQDALAPACSRISSHAGGAEDQGRFEAAEHEDDSGSDHDDRADAAAAGGVVGRVLSRITSKSSVDPGPPPDGGFLAWTQCKCLLSPHKPAPIYA